MAAELSRVANAAMRSASAVRTTTSTLRLTYSPSLLLSPSPASHDTITSSIRGLSLIGCPMRTKRHYADWALPSRSRPPRAEEEGDITKPTGPSSTSPSATRSSPLGSLFENRNAGRSFDPFDSDFSVSPLSKPGEDPTDSTDYTAFFSAGDFSNRPEDLSHIAAKPPVIRCVARTGRTHYVSKGADVGRAFKILDMACTSNKVRYDFNKQKYHERNGQKRKRLLCERWQRKFKGGFKATCKRVSELRRQGW